MSRSDWTGTIPTAPAQLTANETLAADLAFTQYDGSLADSVEMPTLGAKNGLTLASMIGKDFDDPEWNTLLDQLTYDEMVNTITLGFHNTAAAASIGKTATKDENGPQGLTAALTGGASAMCYTSEDVMAATFNVDLINDVGRCIGEDCLAMGYSGLYGPGINMHRTAYSGRNFEYYAEDPFVAGTICAAEVQGIQSKGVYVYLKHVALNDSETSRRGVNTWLNEQTAREIYLEVADKAITDGGAWRRHDRLQPLGRYLVRRKPEPADRLPARGAGDARHVHHRLLWLQPVHGPGGRPDRRFRYLGQPHAQDPHHQGCEL